MGLMRTSYDTMRGMLADQYLGIYRADALPPDALAVRARKCIKDRRGELKFEDSGVIPNGSLVVVGEGQCMLAVDQGSIAAVCTEPGEYVYKEGGEPSVFYGELNDEKVEAVLGRILERLRFGNLPPREQRIYFIQTKEISGCRYGTRSPIPFRLQEPVSGQALETSLRCFGEYAYRIEDPLLFFENVTGCFADVFLRETLEETLRPELLSALQQEFAELSLQGAGLGDLTAQTAKIAESLRETLTRRWRPERGIVVTSFTIGSVSVPPEDQALLRALQRKALLGSEA